MLIDLSKQTDPGTLAADVCVVGAGAAGITLARDLMQAGISVVLLEGGGIDFEAQTQSLYQGRNTGMEYYDLDQARLRFFGGTTNIWGGRCIPLDPIDFKKRDWVAHSGWPISGEDLLPWYKKAQSTLALGEYAYGEDLWQQIGEAPPDFSADGLATVFWRFDNLKERFSWSRCDDLVASNLVKVVLHANAMHIQAAPDANSVEHISVRALSGLEIPVRAKHYVLACGAIENVRLMLASSDVESSGLGNRHDQLGRYFMEHPHGRVGFIETESPFELWSLFRKRFRAPGTDIAPTLVASEAMQEQQGLLNSAMTFKLQRDPDRGVPINKRAYLMLKHSLNPTKSGRMLWHSYRNVRGYLQRHASLPVGWLRAKLGKVGLYVITRAEQAPNPASRVTLSRDLDSFGKPRAALDWQLGKQDKYTVKVLGETLGAELERLSLGKLSTSDWLNTESLAWPVDPTVGNHPIGGYHHMGTTRMSADVTKGVVDKNLAVHGYDNLHIAGSSVFTTGGWANPTLTIVALSHRLAAHLSKLV
ncbi:MAG: GMC family oxidoreductase [Pseudomonadales bacterium]|nr:GMC family oxidoreductase [Pseudomonadales bacterium]